jgi:glutamine synthetase
MILPAAIRYIGECRTAGVTQVEKQVRSATDRLVKQLRRLEKANGDHPAEEGLELAKYMRDKVVPAMDGVRAEADALERMLPDDLWPLPKYSEMLFIK